MSASGIAERADAQRQVVNELEAWRARAVPAGAPLDAADLARLVRSCFDALGIDPRVGADFSVNTVHFYRRKDILDAPAGRTSAARYGVRHLWQAVGARLAGYLGLVTLAEARQVMRGADERALLAFVAARVVDARARQQLRQSVAAPARTAAAPIPVAPMPTALRLPATPAEPEPVARARPLPGALAAAPQPAPAVVIPLPGEAWCIVPSSHAALGSVAAARELVQALAAALRVQVR